MGPLLATTSNTTRDGSVTAPPRPSLAGALVLQRSLGPGAAPAVRRPAARSTGKGMTALRPASHAANTDGRVPEEALGTDDHVVLFRSTPTRPGARDVGRDATFDHHARFKHCRPPETCRELVSPPSSSISSLNPCRRRESARVVILFSSSTLLSLASIPPRAGPRHPHPEPSTPSPRRTTRSSSRRSEEGSEFAAFPRARLWSVVIPAS